MARCVVEYLSVLFNEPKLLKYFGRAERDFYNETFSALQRAEIAEIIDEIEYLLMQLIAFSALQRAEIAEITHCAAATNASIAFSALQRAEIAEIVAGCGMGMGEILLSVLFNEPKLLKLQRVPLT